MIMIEKEVEQVRSRLFEAKKEQGSLKDDYNSIEEKEKETSTTIDELEEEIREEKKSLQALGLRKREIAARHNPLNSVISDSEFKLSEHYKEQKVRSMMAEHPDFYSVLTKRLEVRLEEFKDTLGVLEIRDDPAAIVEKIRSQIEAKGIDHLKIKLRAGKALYNDDLRYICIKKYNNESIPFDYSKKVIGSIDKYLEEPEVSNFWYVQ